MAITRTQFISATGTASPLAITLGSAPTSGKLLVLMVNTHGSGALRTVTSVTTTGTTWTFSHGNSANAGYERVEVWYAKNCGTGNDTSIALSGAVTSVQATLVEYNGFVATPIAKATASYANDNTNPINSSTWTGGSTNGIDQVALWCAAAWRSSTAITTAFDTPFAPFTILDQKTSSAEAASEVVLESIADGTTAATYIQTKYTGIAGGNNKGVIATFKRASASSLIKHIKGTVASGTSLALTLASAPVAGNALILLSCADSTAISSIATTGTTWASAVISSVTPTLEIWYALNIGTANDTTITYASTTGGKAGHLFEFSGLNTSAALDVTASSSSTENPIPTGTTATTAQADELWVGAIGAWGSTEQTGGTSDQPLVTDSVTNGFDASAAAAYTNSIDTYGPGTALVYKSVSATGTASTSAYMYYIPKTTATAGIVIASYVRVPQTLTGRARILKTTTKTLTGRARIRATTTQILTGKANILNPTIKTLTGKADIQKTTSQTLTGKADIQKTTSQTLTGKAAIRVTTIQTLFGLASIRKTVQQTLTGKASIVISASQTLTGKADIQKTTTQTLTGKASIRKTTTQTLSGIAAIRKTVQQTLSGKARIKPTSSDIYKGQSKTGRSATSPLSIALDSPPQPGNMLAAIIYTHGTGTPAISGITTTGNTWVKAVDQVDGTVANVSIWYAANCTANNDTVITASGTISSIEAILVEYVGLAPSFPLDVTSTKAGANSTHPSAVASVTTNYANEVWVSGFGSYRADDPVGSVGWTNPSTGHTIIDQIEGAPDVAAVAACEKVVSATDTAVNNMRSAYCPTAGSYHKGVIATFRNNGSNPIVGTVPASNSMTSGTSLALTLASAPASGDALFIISNAQSSSISSITTTGDTWVKAIESTTSPKVEIWYALNVTTNNDTTIIYDSSSGEKAAVLLRVSNIATSGALDQTASNSTQTEFPIASGTFTPSGQDRFILAALGGYGGGTENIYNRFIGLTNSFTEIAGSGVRSSTNGVGVQAVWKVSTDTGATKTSGWGLNTPYNNVAVLAAFKGTNSIQKTLTGKASIRATVTQTLTGKASIVISASQTLTGKADIQNTTIQTLTGKANIYGTTTQTLTGKAAIRVTTTQTLTGKASIRKTTTQTLSGIAAIRKTVQQTLTGKAAIRVTTTQTLTGKASVTNAVTQTLTGIARIGGASVQTLTGKADIQKTTTQTLTGKASIRVTVTQTLSGIARIQKTIQQTLTGKASIRKTTTQTLTGKANIIMNLITTQTLTGKASIRKTTTQTLSGIASIRKTTTQTLLGQARIGSSVLQTLTGKASIRKTVQQTLTGKASIRKTTTQTLSGIAAIRKTVQQTLTGKASIRKTTTQTLTGLAAIRKTTTQTLTGKAQIVIATTQNLTGRGRIQTVNSKNLTGMASIWNPPIQVYIVDSSGTILQTLTADTRHGLSWTYNAQGGCGVATFVVDSAFENIGSMAEGALVKIVRGTAYGSTLMYQGYIDNKERVLSMDDSELFQINCVGLVSACDDVIVTAMLNNVNWQTAVNAILTAFPVDNVASWTVPAVSYTIQKMEFRETPLMEVLNTLTGFAQDGTNIPYYWGIDENKNGYISVRPTSVKTFHLRDNTSGDNMIQAFAVNSGNFTRIKNRVKVYGGKKADGQQLIIQVDDTTSQTTYSRIKSAILTNNDITDQNDLLQWANGQLKQMAYPRDTGYIQSYPLAEADETFRPWLHKARVDGFNGAPATYDYDLVSTTMEFNTKGGRLDIRMDLSNLDPVWYNIFRAQQLKTVVEDAQDYDPRLQPVLQQDNFVIKGCSPSTP